MRLVADMEPLVSRKVVKTGRESAQYSGPEGEVTFFAFGAMRRGEFVYRGGRMVEASEELSKVGHGGVSGS